MLADIPDLESSGRTDLGLDGQVPHLDERGLNRFIPYKEVGTLVRIAGRAAGTVLSLDCWSGVLSSGFRRREGWISWEAKVGARSFQIRRHRVCTAQYG